MTSSTTSGASVTGGKPGTKATAIPAMTRKIDGARCSLRAATAATANTAIINSSVCTVAVMRPRSCARRLHQVRDHVNGQREDREIEDEGNDAMDGREPPD